MSTTHDKYRQLLLKLHEKTRDGSLSWALDEWDDPYTQVGPRTIFLETGQNSADEPLIIVKIINNKGDVIERFDDEDVKGGQPPEGWGSYFVMMRDLRNGAIRAATGADKALDELLSDLDNAF